MVINNFSWFGKRAFRTWLPAVPIITALIKDCCDFSVLDANVNEWDFDETEKKLRETQADVVLISALSVDYRIQYHKLAQIAKAALPDCTTLMGGVYPTTLPKQVMEDGNIDIIMQGHAEERLPRIIKMVLSKNLQQLSTEVGIGLRINGQLHFKLYRHMDAHITVFFALTTV